MTTFRSYPLPPAQYEDVPLWCRKIADAVIGLMNGKANNVGSVTLTANTATTVLVDRRGTAQSVYHLMPTTANAKAEGHPWISARSKQTVTLNHANNAQTDRTYDYVLVG